MKIMHSNDNMICNHSSKLFSSLCGEMLLGMISNDLPYPNVSEAIRGWVMVSFSIIGVSLAFLAWGRRNTL